MYVIYSKPQCGYCTRAKQLLEIMGEEYAEHNILEDENLTELNTKLGYPVRTVPQIFFNDQLIGGFDKLSDHVKG